MIVANERDERTAAWLVEQYGIEAVERAKTQLVGDRKPHLSNMDTLI